MNQTAVRKFSFWMVIFTSVMHLFCCGLPMIMSVSGLVTMVGITGFQLPGFAWFGRNEPYIMVAGGALLLTTGVIHLLSQRADCRTDGHCVHPPCDTKRDYSQVIFTVAVLLYAGNTLLQATR
jgi:hypothetical protein